MTANLADLYNIRFETVLEPTAEKLQSYIKDILQDAERVDSVSARGKTPVRFAAKALKLNDEKDLKYTDPLNQIQDQIGARITVLYLSDLPKIKSIVDNYFTAIEWQAKKPEKSEEFGYFHDVLVPGKV